MRVLGISGSLRNNSLNTNLLKAVHGLIGEEHQFALYGIDDLPFYNEDIDGDNKPNSVIDWLNALRDADVLLFSVPEYNHSISGVLKNAIDWASRPAFQSVLAHKPTGVLSASMAPGGGARAQLHMKTVLSSTLTPVYPAVDYLLPMAKNAFNSEGSLTDETAIRRLKRYVDGLADWAGSGP